MQKQHKEALKGIYLFGLLPACLVDIVSNLNDQRFFRYTFEEVTTLHIAWLVLVAAPLAIAEYTTQPILRRFIKSPLTESRVEGYKWVTWGISLLGALYSWGYIKSEIPFVRGAYNRMFE